MSSILKALKRLEQQKAARRDADHDIAWIIRDGGSLPEEKRHWPVFAALVVVAAASVFSTYWFMKGGEGRGGAAVPVSEGLNRSSAESPPVPVALPPAPVLLESRAVPPPAPRTGGTPASPASGTPAESPSLESDLEAVEMAAVPRREAVRPVPRRSPSHRLSEPASPRASSPSSPSTLKVTGIAWQNDGQGHIAIVNGVSVSEGSTVEGTRVDKIFPDRVRFSSENGAFEVPLAKGPEGK